ncbi:uncharacterized protein F5147DRAFT_835239 [Suillus discolor]|uniref:Uncharacterized protein n=1 Tax=Suillus discolor TaxID=1912936 RepID=A0A9P7FBC1_9AGAM|nr:uncharacterized protein F5147DRAFT_835239 [Suillus discolor]KAG2113143.1 hypothetical protein F5147DRAFT_835239 [Suillus discolor]
MTYSVLIVVPSARLNSHRRQAHVSGSEDNTIRVWDIEFLNQSHPFKAPAICFSPNPIYALHSAASFLQDASTPVSVAANVYSPIKTLQRSRELARSRPYDAFTMVMHYSGRSYFDAALTSLDAALTSLDAATDAPMTIFFSSLSGSFEPVEHIDV